MTLLDFTIVAAFVSLAYIISLLVRIKILESQIKKLQTQVFVLNKWADTIDDFVESHYIDLEIGG
jgi:hypothetical protein